eukprot:1183772-Prorocentrum_minimum.AAC.4
MEITTRAIARSTSVGCDNDPSPGHQSQKGRENIRKRQRGAATTLTKSAGGRLSSQLPSRSGLVPCRPPRSGRSSSLTKQPHPCLTSQRSGAERGAAQRVGLHTDMWGAQVFGRRIELPTVRLPFPHLRATPSLRCSQLSATSPVWGGGLAPRHPACRTGGKVNTTEVKIMAILEGLRLF